MIRRVSAFVVRVTCSLALARPLLLSNLDNHLNPSHHHRQHHHYNLHRPPTACTAPRQSHNEASPRERLCYRLCSPCARSLPVSPPPAKAPYRYASLHTSLPPGVVWGLSLNTSRVTGLNRRLIEKLSPPPPCEEGVRRTNRRHVVYARYAAAACAPYVRTALGLTGELLAGRIGAVHRGSEKRAGKGARGEANKQGAGKYTVSSERPLPICRSGLR